MTTCAPPSTTPETLPAPGVQPDDRAAAEQAVREMFTRAYTADPDSEEWRSLREAYPSMGAEIERARRSISTNPVTNVRIFQVVFGSPGHVAVEYQMLFANGSGDIRQIGYGVLVDGTWKISRETTCKNLARAGVHCPEGP